MLIMMHLYLLAQDAPLTWKKLTKEEIELTSYDNAPAVVTYEYGQMYFDTNPNGENLFIINKKHVRIKILNEEGLKYAKLKIPYHNMNCERYQGELSFSFKGYTHNVTETGEINSIRLKNKYIKHSDSTDCISIAEIEFKDVKAGSIIEYMVTTPSLQLINPNSWEFQKDIPVLHSEFRARTPKYFKYIFSVKNIEELPIEDSTFYDKILNYRFKYGNRTYSSIIDLSGKEYRFVNYNMPILTDLNKAERINIHLKQAVTEPADYAWQKLTKALMITTWDDYDRRTPSQRKMLTYPPSYFIYYLPTWGELNENLLKDDKFGLALIKFWDCDSILQSITDNSQNEKEKAEAIYNFVKKNMKWNEQYDLYADVSDNVFKTLYSKAGARVKLNNVGNIFEKGEGTSSEINFIFMHLLKKAKIETHPILVNTYKNNPVDKNIPQVKQFVTVIAYVEIDNEKILLDAADPESSFIKPANKYDPDQMFIIRKLDYGWINEFGLKR